MWGIKIMVQSNRILESIFGKTAIKCNLRLENLTSQTMALDLLREEVKALILRTVLEEVQCLISNLCKNRDLGPVTEESIDLVVRVLLKCSRHKVLCKLNVVQYKRLLQDQATNNSNSWSLQAEDYIFIQNLIGLLFSNIRKIQFSSYEVKLESILIENLVIKMANLIASEIFSAVEVPDLFLKSYSTDYFLFKSRLKSLNKLHYWQSYLKSSVFNLKKIYKETYEVFFITKEGIVIKEIYVGDLGTCLKLLPFQIFIFNYLNLNFLKNPQK